MIRIVLAVLLLLGLGYTVASAVTQIQPGERAVVRRFGRVIDTPGPGLFVGLPWGMDRVDRVPIGRVRRVTVGNPLASTEDADSRIPEGQLLTGDHNLVNVQVEIYFTVEEDKVAKFVLQADQADELIARAGAAALAEWVAGRNVDDVLLRGKADIPAWLVGQVAGRVKEYDLGIQVEEASVTHLYPPEKVKSHFDRVARAQTEIRTKIYEAEQEANSKLRSADARSFRMAKLAAAYAREQVLEAKAEAENFNNRLDQYRRLQKQDSGYLTGVWYDEMTRLFSRMRQNGRIDLLDHHLGPDGLDITQMPLLPKKR